MNKLSLVNLQKNEIRVKEQLKIRAGMEDACTCICPAASPSQGYTELKKKKSTGN